MFYFHSYYIPVKMLNLHFFHPPPKKNDSFLQQIKLGVILNSSMDSKISIPNF